MEFYDRQREIRQIREWDRLASGSAQMTVLVGRRRIGKTSLIRKALEQPSLYFFAAGKTEALLCEEFIGAIKSGLGVDIPGEFRYFRDVFKYLLILSETRRFSLVIDEFQEFYTINSAVYSEMQNLWDTYKNSSKIHLVLCGSIYSLMTKIFENAKEPLFQRANHRIMVKPLGIDFQKQILSDYHPKYTNEDLLALYMASGGVPRYIELLMEAKAYTVKRILDELLRENSFFLDEGKNVLIEEFGRDYTTYFSILSLIASGKTSRSDIEGTLGQSVGPQLERLEREFSLIKRAAPLFSKPGTRRIKYSIDDNFLNFWFRFIYKYRSAVEIGNLGYVRGILERDYRSYAGRFLEKYFREKLILSGEFSAIGPWWDKRTANEIDIVAVNDDKKHLLFAEVKLNPRELRLKELELKAAPLLAGRQDYRAEFRGLSLRDM
ncbi:MAG: ATP-binding protein [Spirochaetaceae bacterium]|nr:ATP-binding protein [Spirochaetaceae bacterium]